MAAYLLLLAHSTEDPNRSATALGTAAALQAAGQRVDLWLYGEGVRLGVAHVAETLREPWPPEAGAALDGLAAGGAKLHLSRPCFEQRGFTPDALRPGARLAEPAELAALLAHATPLSV